MPTTRTILARAKLTRTLEITGRRADGYHELCSEMVALDLADEIAITPVPGDASSVEVLDGIGWTVPTGSPEDAGRRLIGGDGHGRPTLDVPSGADNLVLRACRLAGIAAHVRLVKRIPAGAGLGGGSADAAAVLRYAGVLEEGLAASLGADVPFCVRGGRALVTGVGERLQMLPHVDACFLLVTPPFAVSTAQVYRAFDDLHRSPSALSQIVSSQAGGSANDLEVAALAVEPRLGRWRDLLGGVAGSRPTLAGSGSTWFVEVGETDAATLHAEVVSAVESSGDHALVVLARSAAAWTG